MTDSDGKEQLSPAEQLSQGRGPVYWLFMIICALLFAMCRNGCFDGTHDALVKCREVPEYAGKAQCVQCVKSGGVWAAGIGFPSGGECRGGR